MINKLTAAVFLVLLLLPDVHALTAPQTGKFRPGEASLLFAARLVESMSVDEKIGQLVHIGINATYLNQDSKEFEALRRQVVEQRVGGIVVFVGGIYESVHLVNRLQGYAKVPLLISADFETGIGMRFPAAENFPWNMAIAATGNPDFAERLGRLTAAESRALGVQQVFAPVVDVNNNADNPVINVRSFGENPKQVAEFGSAFVKGLQSGNVLATAKHFPGHGDTDVDSHRGLPVLDLDRNRLDRLELLPFRELIAAGVGSVMVSHISLPKIDGDVIKALSNPRTVYGGEPAVFTEGTTIPATLSKPIVTGMLREQLGFDGLIVTDAMDMNGLTLYFEDGEAAVRAIEAGNDVLLKPSSAVETIAGIRAAIASGRLKVEQIDRAVVNQLAWKHKLGLFNRRITPLELIDSSVSGKDARELGREVSENAITLVRHEQGILPLKRSGKILVLAITNGRDFGSVGRVFLNSIRGFGFQAEIVAIDERSGSEETAAAIEKIESADLVIAALFGRVRSGAKNSVALPEAGNQLLKQILGGEKPVVSVAFGNPYLLNAFPGMNTYIVSYGDMESLQRATAGALAGSKEFRGRLPISIGNIPAGTGLRLKEGR